MPAVRAWSRAARSKRRADYGRLDSVIREALAGCACFAQYAVVIKRAADGRREIVK